MAYIFDSSQRTATETVPGVSLRTFWGERMLLALVDLAANAIIPPHNHPHEQIGVMIRGRMEMTIDGEPHDVGPGDVWVIPGGVTHSVRVGPEPCLAAETFAPAREDYKFPD